ncbi:hypothetical protein ACOMHN_011221 [Nucella lapillus]
MTGSTLGLLAAETEKVIQVVDVVPMAHPGNDEDVGVAFSYPHHPPTQPPTEPHHPAQQSRTFQKILHPSDVASQLPDEQRLLNYVLRGYEKSVRPVRNASTPVVIRMGLTLTQIFDMDEKDQVLVTNVWLDQEWIDEFMVWNPLDFNNITMLRIPCHKLWLPDIVLYNNAAEYTDGLMPANAMIDFTGNVFWPVPTKLQSSCKVDVTYFPFDYQNCKLKFGSWTYDGYQVDIINRTTDVDLSNYVVNGEWQLVYIRIVRNIVRYACCEEPFPDVTFHIKIRRRTLYYMYNVVFPCVMMSALTLLVFCLPPDSGEKIALGITVLLAFSVFMLAVAENLPETSEFVPLISIYLTIVMSLTSVSVIMTVFVLNLHHRGPDKRAIPTWIRRLFLGSVRSRGSLFSHSFGGHGHAMTSSGNEGSHVMRNLTLKVTLENLAHELRDELHLENGGLLEGRNNSEPSAPVSSQPSSPHPPPSSGFIVPPTSTANSSNVTRGLDFSHLQTGYPQQHPPPQQQQPSPSPTPSNFNTPEGLASHILQQGLGVGGGGGGGGGVGGKTPSFPQHGSGRRKTNYSYEDVLLSLLRILERHEREEKEYESVQDWRRLAQTVDRILFFFFLFLTVGSTLAVLVVTPSLQE